MEPSRRLMSKHGAAEPSVGSITYWSGNSHKRKPECKLCLRGASIANTTQEDWSIWPNFFCNREIWKKEYTHPRRLRQQWPVQIDSAQPAFYNWTCLPPKKNSSPKLICVIAFNIYLIISKLILMAQLNSFSLLKNNIWTMCFLRFLVHYTKLRTWERKKKDK